MFTIVSIIAVVAVLWSLVLMYTLGKKGHEIVELQKEIYTRDIMIDNLMKSSNDKSKNNG